MTTSQKQTLSLFISAIFALLAWLLVASRSSPPILSVPHAETSTVWEDQTAIDHKVERIIWSKDVPEAMLTFPDGSLNNMRHVQDLEGMTFRDVDGKVWIPTWRVKQ